MISTNTFKSSIEHENFASHSTALTFERCMNSEGVKMTTFTKDILQMLFRVVCSSILFAFLLILFPISLVLISPLFLWRIIVLSVVKVAYSDIHEIFLALDVFFSIDDWYGNPDSGIPVVAFLEGSVDVDKFRRDVMELIVKHERADKTLKYDKLQQYPVRIGGFYFWKWDRDFSLDNHIKLLSDVSLNDNNLSDFITLTTRNAYEKNRPLWDINFVPNFNGDKNQTLMVLRLHHCCADGYSTLKLVLSGFMNIELDTLPEFAKSTRIPRSAWENILHTTKLVFGFPYLYLREISKLRDRNPLHDPKNVKLSGDWVASFSPKFQLKDLKEAKIRLKAPVTAILTSSLAGGLISYLERHKHASTIPKKMHFLYPNPLPGHPDDKLTNHWAMGTSAITLNIRDIEERLKRTTAEFYDLVKSPFAMVNHFMFMILGTLPASIADHATRFQGFTFVLSNFPGPPMHCSILEYPMKDVIFWLPLMRSLTGINFSVISYCGGVRIGILADKSYIPDKSLLDELCMDVYQELCKILTHEPSQRMNFKNDIEINMKSFE